MATSVREIKLERTLVYRLNLAEVRLFKDLVRQLTGTSSFTGRITIDCCTGGIGEVTSRGKSETLPEIPLTPSVTYDNQLTASEPSSATS